MKKAFTAAFLFCLASSIANARDPVTVDLVKELKCSEAEFVIRHFAENYGEKPLWVGKSNTNSHITLLVNKEKRSWTLVEYDSKMACVLGAGDISSSNEVF
jgi:hypothetical protein